MATKVDHNPEWQEPEATEDWDNGINFGTLWSQTFMNFKLVEYPYPFVLKAFAILAFKSVLSVFPILKMLEYEVASQVFWGKWVIF